MDIAMIDAARARLGERVRRTPLLTSPFLDEIAGRPVFVKPECLQHTGSFKFRGAWSAVSALAPEVRARGVLAYSSGNHAQGVALAAQLSGIPAVIVMPADAPRLKIDNTRAYGAEVVLYDRFGEDREVIGAALAAERGLTLIRPYDEPLVIAGQGTVGLEIAEDCAALGISRAEVLVPCGGGGLTAGIALALAREAPGLRVRPCEPEGFDDTARSLAAGERRANAPDARSICDAIVTPRPGEITFPILQAHCGPGFALSDAEVLRAMRHALLRLKLAPEPGGTVALAAALFRPPAEPGLPVIAVVSGGNADPDMLLRALQAE